MKKRWEVVSYATDQTRGQFLAQDSTHRNQQDAEAKAARMNGYGDGTKTITYEARKIEAEPKFEPWSHRWLVQGTKRDIRLDQHWYRTKRSADSWSQMYTCNPTWDYTPQRNPLVPEMPWNVRRISNVVRRLIVVAATCLLVVVAITTRTPLDVLLAIGCIASNVPAELTYRRYVNGLRRTARDRHDSRTPTGQTSGAGTSNTNPGTSPRSMTAGFGGVATVPAGLSSARVMAALGYTPSGIKISNGQVVMRNNTVIVPARQSRIAAETGSLPEREDDTPILGYKTATLAWARTEEHQTYQPTLESVYSTTAFNLTADRAECHRGGDHTAPDLACTCGFYAVRERERVEDIYGHAYVLLDVELFGKVIVYEHGYRAERQRILSIGVRGCWYCNETPSHLVGQAPTPWSRTDTTADLISVCTEHLPLAGANLIFTTEEIGVVLGAPVRHEPSLIPTVDPGRMNS